MPCELDVRWSHVQPAGVGSHMAPGFLRDPAVPAPDEQERVPSLDSHLIEHEQVDRAPLAQHFEGRVDGKVRAHARPCRNAHAPSEPSRRRNPKRGPRPTGPRSPAVTPGAP